MGNGSYSSGGRLAMIFSGSPVGLDVSRGVSSGLKRADPEGRQDGSLWAIGDVVVADIAKLGTHGDANSRRLVKGDEVIVDSGRHGGSGFFEVAVKVE